MGTANNTVSYLSPNTQADSLRQQAAIQAQLLALGNNPTAAPQMSSYSGQANPHALAAGLQAPQGPPGPDASMVNAAMQNGQGPTVGNAQNLANLQGTSGNPAGAVMQQVSPYADPTQANAIPAMNPQIMQLFSLGGGGGGY